MSASDIILGTTLYSLTNEYHSREYSFEDIVRELAKRGLTPGLEVVGFQSIREFPQISDRFAGQFKDLIAETGLLPSCLSINADVKLRSDRVMTAQDAADYHVPQIEAAKKLGFPIVRVQPLIVGPEVYEKLLPLAERLDIKMGVEIHAPQRVDAPEIIEFREVMERLNSPCLGFVPDFSSSSRAVPANYQRYLLAMGVPKNVLEYAIAYWMNEFGATVSHNIEGFTAKLHDLGATPHAASLVNRMISMFGRQPVAAWSEIMPRVVHVHAKFYDVDDGEGSIDYTEIFKVFTESGYAGHWSSEWEGHVYTDDNGFENLEGQRAVSEKILKSLQ